MSQHKIPRIVYTPSLYALLIRPTYPPNLPIPLLLPLYFPFSIPHFSTPNLPFLLLLFPSPFLLSPLFLPFLSTLSFYFPFFFPLLYIFLTFFFYTLFLYIIFIYFSYIFFDVLEPTAWPRRPASQVALSEKGGKTEGFLSPYILYILVLLTYLK